MATAAAPTAPDLLRRVVIPIDTKTSVRIETAAQLKKQKPFTINVQGVSRAQQCGSAICLLDSTSSDQSELARDVPYAIKAVPRAQARQLEILLSARALKKD
jgi:hypothetical protein